MKIKIEYIILILLFLMVINSAVSWFVPVGMSNEEHALKLKLNDLEQEKVVLKKKNNQLEFKIKSFEYEILKNDSIIDNANIYQLDSMFTNYFNR